MPVQLTDIRLSEHDGFWYAIYRPTGAAARWSEQTGLQTHTTAQLSQSVYDAMTYLLTLTVASEQYARAHAIDAKA
jgi:hypothetical protein